MNKTINEVVADFKNEFGEITLKATNFQTGQVGGSKNWIDPPAPRAEINATEYLALGDLQNKNDRLRPGTLKNICSVIKMRRLSETSKRF